MTRPAALLLTILPLIAPTPGLGQAPTFSNPIASSGPDPWSIYQDGWYYHTHTTGGDLRIWKTRSLADLERAESKVAWKPPETGPYSRDIWAPELHRLGGKWYFYFAADGGANEGHRLFVLENPSTDPMRGDWTMKGQIHTPGGDRWAIDGSILEYRGRLYLVWSGWEGTTNGTQNLYICRLKDPWTTEGDRALISTPRYPWEKVGDLPEPTLHVDVNEGPQPLVHGDRVFIVYSASGCWTEHYALGMIYADGSSDLLDPRSWTKVPKPVFKSEGARAAKVHGAGHNSFFRSPDGTEDWILYHANPEPADGCGGKRSPRMQKFRWTAEGFPDFGKPVSAGTPLSRPSGDPPAAKAR